MEFDSFKKWLTMIKVGCLKIIFWLVFGYEYMLYFCITNPKYQTVFKTTVKASIVYLHQ